MALPIPLLAPVMIAFIVITGLLDLIKIKCNVNLFKDQSIKFKVGAKQKFQPKLCGALGSEAAIHRVMQGKTRNQELNTNSVIQLTIALSEISKRKNKCTFVKPTVVIMIKRYFFHFGRYVLFMFSVLSRPQKWSMYYKETMRQMDDIGIRSLQIVLIISVFIGAVTAVQLSYQLGDTLVPKYYVGYILRDLMIIDMAPTITCLVLAGKVGSNIAAELGGMRQKEHIDAMEIMGVNTPSFLVLPKLVAAVVTIPMLIILAAGLSIGSGFFVSTISGNFTSAEFLEGVTSFYIPYNVIIMIVKSLVYAFILTTVSAYHGYHVKAGSIALGRAGTDAVVYSNILILVADYIIATVMF